MRATADERPYIFARSGGTTMFTGNKEHLLANYLTAFGKLRAAHPEARLAVIGRKELTEDVDGVVFLNCLSAHLLWIGERTRSLTGPHIEFATAVANPVAVKLGPRCTPEEMLALHGVLNPRNQPGRLTFVLRMGRAHAYERSRLLLAAAAGAGLADRFVSDPMHGNGVTSAKGVKTRTMRAIEEELRAFFEACRDTGTLPGGVHLEVSGDDVTECVDAEIDDACLAERYRTSCDPRLDPAQALRIADLVGHLLAGTPAPGRH
ncbi:3-deoxy-7-phosphoheptulonate synthase [Streptomyces anandii]|uniref:Phospho-2-dehydro-3-deoxyheptonate aldolase n=1 Tax=Streptomyces anandii TaxID=285454 RepID=A0ABW6H1S7_9ACTN